MRVLRAKVIVAGDARVGKTSLVSVFSQGSFPKSYNVTGVCDIVVKNVHIPDTSTDVELFLLDSGGNPLFRESVASNWKNANLLMLVYDCTNEQSFKDLQMWLDLARNAQDGKLIPGVLIANKTDAADRLAVPAARGAEFAASNGLEFFECSALQGADADAPFYYLANRFHRIYEEKVQLMLEAR